MNYSFKEITMRQMLEAYPSPDGFRSIYKAVPIGNYEQIKQYIDFTKYFVMFRGPRPSRYQNSTRKRDAHSFDVYERDARTVRLIRVEREAFQRGVKWANNRSH